MCVVEFERHRTYKPETRSYGLLKVKQKFSEGCKSRARPIEDFRKSIGQEGFMKNTRDRKLGRIHEAYQEQKVREDS